MLCILVGDLIFMGELASCLENLQIFNWLQIQYQEELHEESV